MAGPIENLSFVARRLIQYERRFALANPRRKVEAATLFSRIAASLQALASDLGRDQLPNDPSRELVLYSTRLAECVGEELGEPESERLANVLAEASDKERLYLQYRSSENKKDLAEELEKASILIQALANGLCPTPPPTPGWVESPLA
ncbi:MAG: hypothetical protein JF616_13520 [Fibrobacteres bacterium]|jgi:hypothetical protein|nr:hypothetical protein [Fibrobacterota bacterium]